jgi:ADP-heptose:LPS heptosyltransferase
VIVLSKYEEIFLNNIFVFKFFKFNQSSYFSRILYKFFEYFNFDMIRNFSPGIENKNRIFGLKNFQNIHLSEYLSLRLNLKIDFQDYKPDIFFSDNEIIKMQKKFRLPKKFAVIQASGKTTFTENKEWKFEKFQSVVNKTKDINWIQLCTLNDKKLDNVKSVYDNINLRELFFIIFKSEFVLCLEGFYNHIAAAFNRKTFLVLSGFVNENNVKYKKNFMIEKSKKLDCAPCYKLFKCDVLNKPCTSTISSKDVVNIIKKNIN